MLDLNFDISQLFAVSQSIFSPLLPLILLIFGVVLAAYLIEFLPDIFCLMGWAVKKTSYLYQRLILRRGRLLIRLKELEKLIKIKSAEKQRIIKKFELTEEELPIFLKKYEEEKERLVKIAEIIEKEKEEIEKLKKIK